MTDRLYYNDSYLLQFDGNVKWRSDDGLEVELDRTAFYPTSGGQPNDLGSIAELAVVDVFEKDERIIHRMGTPMPADFGLVHGQIDPIRRLDHMRHHSGQHLLSAVMEEEFKLKTVSFHLGADYATVDVEPQSVSPGTLEAIETRVNQRLLENRPLRVSFEESSSVLGLRKPPDREGILRIVTIEGLDRSACGGTHVRQTGEIGCIALGKTEKVRIALRIEFYCGPRALQFLRAKILAAETQVGGLRERLSEADKQRRRLAAELADIAGRKKYTETAKDETGRVVWVEHFDDLLEDSKMMANAFLAGPRSLVVLTGRASGSILLGANPDLGLDCGKVLKSVLTELGGKGGGSKLQAQGTVSENVPLERAVAILLKASSGV